MGDDKCKVVVAGDASVGKTSLLSKFLFNIFVQDYNFTVGIDFHSKIVNLKSGEAVRLQLWDTAGQERFRALLPSYLRDCCTILIVYDVTNRKTFDGIPFWIDYVKRHTTKQPPIILVGMKIDLINREVAFADAQTIAKKYDLNVFEVSAATGEGVEALFQKTAEIANERLKLKLTDSSENFRIPFESFDSMTEQKRHKKCC
uniref:Uncharacterized protein n=1 Tax=Panagrolaimus sp. ES5 TaxID=591445 RepID=A0AC34GTM4_9BILA